MGEQLLGTAHNLGLSVGVDISVKITVKMLLKCKLSLTRPPVVRVNSAGAWYLTQVNTWD